MNQLIQRYNFAYREWILSCLGSESKYQDACEALDSVVEEIRQWQKETNVLLDAEYGPRL